MALLHTEEPKITVCTVYQLDNRILCNGLSVSDVVANQTQKHWRMCFLSVPVIAFCYVWHKSSSYSLTHVGLLLCEGGDDCIIRL